MRRLLIAGVLTGVVDGLFSSVLSAAFYGSTVTRLLIVLRSSAIRRALASPAGVIRVAAVGGSS